MVSKKVSHKKLHLFMLFAHFITSNIMAHPSLKDYSHLFTIKTLQQQFPSTVQELQKLTIEAIANNKKICIVGAGKSQGGQTTSSENSIRINLKNLNKPLMFDVQNKHVTVQTGMTWDDLQKFLAPHKLAVKSMQSFNDFSIGGSLSVNVHGQDFHSGTLIKTVRSCKLLTPQAELITISRTENPELFSLVIGGYGLFGIIVEVTLDVTDDVILRQKSVTLDANQLGHYFFTHIKNNPNIAFYSARYSLNTKDPLKKVLAVSYEKTTITSEKAFEFNPNNLQSQFLSTALKTLFNLLEKYKSIKNARFWLEELYFSQNEIISRNNFMARSIKSLPTDNDHEQHILQEYFIPYDHLNTFVAHLATTIQQYDINLLNVTARHIQQENESFLSFTQHEACALVLYVTIKKTQKDYEATAQWTNQLIDHALSCRGSYYLPYQLLGTQKQIETCYPMFRNFVALKKTYDPQELFSNSLYEKYR